MLMNDLNALDGQLSAIDTYHHPIRIYIEIFHMSQKHKISIHELLGSGKTAISIRIIHDLAPEYLPKTNYTI